MHLTNAGPVSAGAPSVVQEEWGSELTRGQCDGFADTCAQIAMGDFLKSYCPSRPSRPVRPGGQGAVSIPDFPRESPDFSQNIPDFSLE